MLRWECLEVPIDHDEHPYILWSIGAVTSCYVAGCIYVGICVMKTTATGLPNLLEAHLLLVVSAVMFPLLIYSTNILGFRHGWPNNVLLDGVSNLAEGMIASGLLLSTTAVRVIFLRLQGVQRMRPRERDVHRALFVTITLALGPCTVLVKYIFHLSLFFLC